MFLKQYNYKPRSNSTSSEDKPDMANKNTTEPASPTQNATMGADGKAAAQGGRRRSSVDQQYQGLHGYKRSSQDEAATARKASWADQKQQPGYLGQMWNKFTTGN